MRSRRLTVLSTINVVWNLLGEKSLYPWIEDRKIRRGSQVSPEGEKTNTRGRYVVTRGRARVYSYMHFLASVVVYLRVSVYGTARQCVYIELFTTLHRLINIIPSSRAMYSIYK